MHGLRGTVLLVIGCILAVDCEYQIGVGIADVTGPVVGIPFLGYANIWQIGQGLHLRQFARAFIINDGHNSVVFVVVDVGMIGYGLRKEVLTRLKEHYNDKYTEQNVVISATDTHSAPGGFMMDFVFDITSFGFTKETFEVLASGITQAIMSAHKSMEKGKVFVNTGELLGVNVNRSPTAYMLNSEEERYKYKHDVDKEMVQLQFLAMDNRPIGVINWFSIDATSMNNSNALVSSDNVGYASILFEQYMNKDSHPGKGHFVAAFAVTNGGDVSPNVNGPVCHNTGTPCDEETSTCDGSAALCRSVGPGKDQFDSTKIIGNALFGKAKELWGKVNSRRREVKGSIKSAHQFIDMETTVVEYIKPDGSPMLVHGCSPALGYSFAAGTVDGPGLSNFVQGTTDDNPFWNTLRDIIAIPTEEDIACHYPKPILLLSGRAKFPYPWQSSVVSVQLSMIGDFVLAAVPGEFTTMAGRRLAETILNTIKENGGSKHDKVIIGGFSNTYSHSVSTAEEYGHQRYEGASTVFGPYTLNIYMDVYKKLAVALLKNKPVDVGKPPMDLSDYMFSFVPPVLFDSPGNRYEFGECVVEPPKFVLAGSAVTAEFIAGNPKNNFMTGKSFLTVDKLENGEWTTIATDADWETKFIWRRTLIFEGMSQATIVWHVPLDVESGVYRIQHFGFYKIMQDGIYPYSGSTDKFLVASSGVK